MHPAFNAFPHKAQTDKFFDEARIWQALGLTVNQWYDMAREDRILEAAVYTLEGMKSAMMNYDKAEADREKSKAQALSKGQKGQP